jgi:DnaK suppressor protein
MTEDERKELREKILSQIGELGNEIEAHRESSKPVEPDVAIGRLTRMDAIGAKHISEASLASAQSRLSRLEIALRRIDKDPDFGLCSDCEETIPIKRLMLMPEANRCVRCAEGSS